MKSAFELLKNNGRFQLAKILEKCGEMPVIEYSQKLYDYPVPCQLEPELLQAFQIEFERLEFAGPELGKILTDLEQNRILQTSTHLTASEGPTFFAIHWLASLGLPSQNSYLIGAFSGVSFSNSAWPGCLNFGPLYTVSQLLNSESPLYQELLRAEKDRGKDTGERRISLLPGTLRDALVYRAPIPERFSQILPYLCSELKSVFSETQIGSSYSRWAIQSCQNVSNRLFEHKKILYFDLNEVIAQYLQMTLTQSTHFLYRLFFDDPLQKRVLQEFGPDVPFFTAPLIKKNKVKWETLTIEKKILKGSHQQIPLTPEAIVDALGKGKVCPGIFLTFTVLSFLNGFKCLGSFEQIEYLTQFKEKWQRLGLLDQQTIENVKTDGLTTGRFLDEGGMPVFPLDVILGTEWRVDEKSRMQDLIEPLLPRLLRTG
ncbi:MAG: hypothetical protein HQM13_22335 [SAR324 cluster bacterium]|nr:hypothetical protein [SAR324 cluster bacterium]